MAGAQAGGAPITGPDEPGTYRLETEATLSDGIGCDGGVDRRRTRPRRCPLTG